MRDARRADLGISRKDWDSSDRFVPGYDDIFDKKVNELLGNQSGISPKTPYELAHEVAQRNSSNLLAGLLAPVVGGSLLSGLLGQQSNAD
jgi:hypothetical protein